MTPARTAWLRVIAAAGVAALVAAACGGSTDSDARSSAAVPPIPLAESAPALLLSETPNDQLARLPTLSRAVDPATLAYLDESEALDTLRYGHRVVSPDGALFAGIGRPQGSDVRDDTLRIFDLTEWRELPAVEGLGGRLGSIAWSPDAATLFVSEFIEAGQGDEGPFFDERLWAIDVATQRGRLIGDLPFHSSTVPIVSPDGRWLYLLGYHGERSPTGVLSPSGDPFLAAVDVASGTVTQIPIPGMRIGSLLVTRDDGEFHGTFVPGYAMSPDGTRFYVAHPDEDKVTVIDLARLEVTDVVSVAKPSSVWARIGSSLAGLFVDTAEAKGGLFFIKKLAVSPDGRWLYITGTRDVPCDGQPAIACEYGEPLGLKIVDTATLDLIHEFGEISDIIVAPGGQLLLGLGAPTTDDTGSHSGRAGTRPVAGIRLIDTNGFAVVALLDPQLVVDDVVIDGSGRYAYLQADGPGWEIAAGGFGNPLCRAQCSVIHILDLEQRAIVADRIVDAKFLELISRYP